MVIQYMLHLFYKKKNNYKKRHAFIITMHFHLCSLLNKLSLLIFKHCNRAIILKVHLTFKIIKHVYHN